ATESARLAGLRDRFEATLRARIPAIRVNAAGAPRLPSTSSLAFEGVDAQSLLARLDLDGVAVSSGSACAAGASEPSHVLAALEAPAWVQLGTIRFSFGRLTSEEDVTRLGEMLPKTIASMREPGRLVGTFGSGPRAGRSEGRPCPSA
ncbi:MAG TPA: aminotransferase class V-fold PLP-dependent enzyme, partial [Candidatus Baltobacteraceae bacterium]|nr:aminotransferase class V-fold PLP-dependent enzyme [Candidatus Baltobacteraceae bacterium]